MAALVFKTTSDPFVGRLSYFRVFSGSIKADSVVYNSRREEEERIANIFTMRGKTQIPMKQVPAGDIGVGGREVGYMFGMYKKLAREFTGTFTGKGLEFGGSLIRPEATGFGGLYFVNQMLQTKGIDIKGKTVAISGFGNVAWGAATKATELGAKVVTISGPDGYIYDPNGISGEKIDYMLELRSSGNDIVAPYADEFPGSTFVAGKRPWEVKADIALPCATQNELNGEDAQHLIDNKVTCVGEISNMGCTPEAIDLFIENKIMYAPGKAVNAGGVATSGLEMSQNAMHLSWSAAEVDEKLHAIMTRNSCSMRKIWDRT